MKHEDLKRGDKVVYIPKYLLKGPKKDSIKEENLGVVSGKNERYVFVIYKDKTMPQATKASDLYSLDNRPDLADLI